MAFVWHLQIPDYLKIDKEESLLGSMKPYKRHVLFQTPGGYLQTGSCFSVATVVFSFKVTL